MSSTPLHDNETPKPPKPWYKRWWGIVLIVLAALFIFGGILNALGFEGDTTASNQDTTAATSEPATAEASTTEETTVTTETSAPEATTPSAAVPEWQQNEKYATYCNPDDATIAPELAAVVEAVAIPEGGHIQAARYRTAAGNPDAHEIGFSVCTPLAGDDLRRLAEELAIQVNAAGLGGDVSTMGVHALPDDTTPETILRDKDYQANLHDGGPALENGAYRAAWESQN